jgi:hypothetical protein
MCLGEGMADMKAKGKDVEAFVKVVEPGKRALIEKLRAFVKSQAPQLKEQIKWGNICWIGKSNVCWIIVYNDHVDFGFFKGAELKDPKKLLEGTGKGLRHVKVRAASDIKEMEFAGLLKEAVALDG